AQAFLARDGGDLAPRQVIECRFYNLWNSETRYRKVLSAYGPHWKPMGFIYDRRVDYPRDPSLRPLHEPRIPVPPDAPALRVGDLPVLHLQWVIWNRNQLKQAW